jgi:uncharacterized protein (TIGR02646 family)
MIRLPASEISAEVAASLRAYQDEIDAGATYSERVGTAKLQFSRRNRADNPTFQEVRIRLRRMCRGVIRCMFCEDSLADEIEHFRPKGLYPELTFVWPNYLYACGPCNGPKNNNFAVFSAATGAVVDVARLQRAPIAAAPEPGDSLLINPRHENPMSLLRLELRDTFRFEPMAALETRECSRAQYTIRVLRLNREELCVMRRDFYEQYAAVLHLYIAAKALGASQPQLERKISVIARMSHPTVWHEMRRQRDHHPRLRALFTKAPEALDW